MGSWVSMFGGMWLAWYIDTSWSPSTRMDVGPVIDLDWMFRYRTAYQGPYFICRPVQFALFNWCISLASSGETLVESFVVKINVCSLSAKFLLFWMEIVVVSDHRHFPPPSKGSSFYYFHPILHSKSRILLSYSSTF
jgi:hypothetical protein